MEVPELSNFVVPGPFGDLFLDKCALCRRPNPPVKPKPTDPVEVQDLMRNIIVIKLVSDATLLDIAPKVVRYL